MRAARAYGLLTSGPSRPRLLRFLADPDAVVLVEVVEIDSGEVVLFWDCPAADAGRMTRALRADLAQLDADEFLDRWTAIETVDDLR